MKKSAVAEKNVAGDVVDHVLYHKNPKGVVVNMKKMILAVGMSLVFMSGCALMAPINEDLYSKYLTKTYNCSKDKCFVATLAALKELKINVDKMNEEEGTITTEREDFFSQVQVSGYASGGAMNASGQQVKGTHKYYLKITGNETTATVTALRYRLWANNVEQKFLNAMYCKPNVWDPLFDTIGEKIAEE